MTRGRIIAAVAVAVLVAALLGWQQWRSRLIAACAEEAGIWDGRRCLPDERRIRIQRELQRT